LSTVTQNSSCKEAERLRIMLLKLHSPNNGIGKMPI
jgi:hypothetical protein